MAPFWIISLESRLLKKSGLRLWELGYWMLLGYVLGWTLGKGEFGSKVTSYGPLRNVKRICDLIMRDE